MKKSIGALLVLCGLAGVASLAHAVDTTWDVYGYVMMDAGYDTKQVDPQWFDTMRPTKLPAFEDQFGADGNTFFGVRQTRFGVKTTTPTDRGDFTTQFEWELFGVGADAGQTTIRLRHAYGQLGKVGAGQTWSPFMDIGVFPNSLEYWGPNGMVFFRNVQVRYMPLQGETFATIALERPGASGDQGVYSNRVELNDIAPHFPVPDISAEYHVGKEWGYIEIAGIFRRIEWEDMGTDSLDLEGSANGWGLNLSSNIKIGDASTVRASIMYGEGVENYMNDAPADVGIKNVGSGIEGVALPVFGLVAFLDHNWNEKFSSSVGYSMIDIDNSSGQSPNAFHRGHYALGNLLYYPTKNVMAGAELQYGKRENFSDDFTSDDVKLQVSFRYNYATQF